MHLFYSFKFPCSRTRHRSEFGPFEIPDSMEEDSVNGNVPGSVISDEQADQPVQYEIVESSTQCGRKKLVDSSGYSYTVKRRYSEENAFWRCSVRNKTTSCLVTVRQHGMVFTTGPHMHCHQPIVGTDTAAKITRDVKEKAMNDYYQPAGMIVEQVLLKQLGKAPCPAMPKVTDLARQANRKRQKSRPVEPSDLEFELSPQHMPSNFLKADVKVGHRPHLVFSTSDMLSLLAKSKQWYVIIGLN